MKYRRRALSILLALTMILTFMPAMSFATNDPSYEAQIGDTKYTTLSDAISAAKDGDTVKLLSDVTLTADDMSNPQNPGYLEIRKAVTVDLNGFTVEGTNCGVFDIYDDVTIQDSSDDKTGKITSVKWTICNNTAGKTLTITGGTFESTGVNPDVVIIAKGTLIMSGGTVLGKNDQGKGATGIWGKSGSIVEINGDAVIETTRYGIFASCAVVNMKGGTITSHTGIQVVGNGNASSAELNMTGGSVYGANVGIMGNGSLYYAGTVYNISGGTISSDRAALYHPQQGILNISGGTFTGNVGIYQKSGVMNITGGTITGNGDKNAYQHKDSDWALTGDAVVVDNCGYPGGSPSASITGGSFNSVKADAVHSYVKQDDPEYSTKTYERVKEFISSGTFSSSVTPLIVSDGVAATVTNTDGETAYVVGEKTVQEAANIEDNAIVVTQGDIALDPETTKATVTNDGTGVVKVGDKEVNTSSEELAEMKKNAREDAEKIDALEKAKADAEKAKTDAEKAKTDAEKAKADSDKTAADTKAELDALKKSVEDEKNIEAKYAPAKVKLTKAVKGKNRITVSFKKVTKNVAGYQIRLVNKTDGKRTYITVKKSSKKTIKKTVKNLYGNTKYKVNVRAFNKVNGKRVYGKWSNTKTVKVK